MASSVSLSSVMSSPVVVLTATQTLAEAADVLFFAMTAMARAGVSMADVERVLDRRALRTTRRAGDAKPGALG